ncbi:MAG TPA: Hsp20/alpha crystallin family protein [Gemmatimonadaceae bacterium]|nr:Hsp20/alpha crystallin family protein [Gemmatimonadaceae bacterium]
MLYNLATASPIFGLRREIDRLFEDTFTRGGSAWTPAVDIKETESDLRLDLELPGLRPEDVEITCENGILTIRGEKRNERKEGEENRYHLVERTYGSFMRSFTLPQGIDENQIEANFDNGILSVHIPKTALPQPKKIQISGGQQKQQAAVGNGSTSNQNQHSNNQQSTRNSGKSSSQRERSGEQVAAQSR